MTESAGATIIPFPRPHRNELMHSAERLAEALTSLSVALTRQREATKRWSDALHDLSRQMHSAKGS